MLRYYPQSQPRPSRKSLQGHLVSGVFSSLQGQYSTTAPIDFGRSASLSSILVCICMGMWLMQNYITGKNSYRLVGGKGSRPARTKLSPAGQAGAWLWVALVVLAAIGVPYFSIIATSLIRLRGYGLAAGNFTLDHYKELLTTPKALSSIWKSLFLAVSSASLCSVLGTAVVVAVRKSKGFFRKTLEGVSLLPLLEGKHPKDWRRSLYYHYYEYPAEHSVRRHYGVSTADGWKLVHFYPAPDEDPKTAIDSWEMYDLNADPHEMNNIYGKPGTDKQLKRLKKELLKLQKQYDDPIEEQLKSRQ